MSLTSEFCDVCEPDLEQEKPSAMLRICLLAGPPVGVNPGDHRLLRMMLAAMERWPELGAHEAWAEIAREQGVRL